MVRAGTEEGEREPERERDGKASERSSRRKMGACERLGYAGASGAEFLEDECPSDQRSKQNSPSGILHP